MKMRYRANLHQSQVVFRDIRPLDLLEEYHAACVIDRVVELLDLEELHGECAEEGKPAYHPNIMVKVLFYTYYAWLMSCRKMWNGLKHRAYFVFLSGDQVPDFRTLNTFRSHHMNILPKLFAQVVLLCVKVGMVDFQHLAIDGQRFQADASYRRSKTRKRVKKSYDRVREVIAQF